eukprot:9466319-Pyramimonas_sp.AAC.1
MLARYYHRPPQPEADDHGADGRAGRAQSRRPTQNCSVGPLARTAHVVADAHQRQPIGRLAKVTSCASLLLRRLPRTTR